jgi:hypothetical protein
MNPSLKTISKEGIPEALSKAERYRLLNEPGEAESICRDVMAVEPDHQGALRLLGLALTDQFVGGAADRHVEAEGVFERLRDPYEKLYYAGIVHERRDPPLEPLRASPPAARLRLAPGARGLRGDRQPAGVGES